MVVSFDDLSPDRGLTVALVEPGLVHRTDTVTGTGDGEVTLPGTVLANTFYDVVAWVDEDVDGICEPGVDTLWRTTTGAAGIAGSDFAWRILGTEATDDSTVCATLAD